MKIRNFLILLITMTSATLSAAAQQDDGSVTYTDYSKQSITISRFGTVRSFKNSDGKEIVPNHRYRVCSCGNKSQCVDSDAPTDTTIGKLEVVSPRKGTTLGKGEVLMVDATVSLGELSVMRRLAWVAGTNVVDIVESMLANTPVCKFEEGARVPLKQACPVPPLLSPDPQLKCPPPSSTAVRRYLFGTNPISRVTMNLSRQL